MTLRSSATSDKASDKASGKPAIWLTRLDHLIRETDQPEALAEFYSGALAMETTRLDANRWVLRGHQRRLLIQRGSRGQQPLNGFRVPDIAQLQRLSAHCEQAGLEILAQASPLFTDGFCLRDPDGRVLAFGTDQAAMTVDDIAGKLRGRLQHVVVATTDLPAITDFYQGKVGFAISDHVIEPGGEQETTASFFRSDPEHHSFAAFRAPESRPDHFSLEVDSWNDIRDWADHMAALEIKLWWGPGRHGPGNNLFFMIEDPEGYKLELSAEIEHVPLTTAPRVWPHEERTLNLWGGAWMRS